MKKFTKKEKMEFEKAKTFINRVSLTILIIVYCFAFLFMYPLLMEFSPFTKSDIIMILCGMCALWIANVIIGILPSRLLAYGIWCIKKH